MLDSVQLPNSYGVASSGLSHNSWKLKRQLAALFTFPALLWVSIWLGINTGPWIFEHDPESFIGLLHYIRTLFPFFVLFVFLFQLGASSAMKSVKLPFNVRMWLMYGVVAAIASIMSPYVGSALYWAGVYLSVFAGIKVYLAANPGIEGLVSLNYLSWIVGAVFFAILVVSAKDVLFVSVGGELTGYGIVNRMSDVDGMAMSRSSGMSRFAAIPGIVAFVFFLGSSFKTRWFWLGAAVACAGLIYLMQSRGAIFAYVGALGFTMLFFDKKIRMLGLFLLLLLGLGAAGNLFSSDFVSQIAHHLQRGQSLGELVSLTGRDRAWNEAWTVFYDSPLLGYGFQADRYLIFEHVHNTYMYALLSGGAIGAGLFVLGLMWSWMMYLKIAFSGYISDKKHKLFFVQVGALLAFFTLRSVPEVCGAMFGVDIMIMLPAIAYIGFLHVQMKAAKAVA